MNPCPSQFNVQKPSKKSGIFVEVPCTPKNLGGLKPSTHTCIQTHASSQKFHQQCTNMKLAPNSSLSTEHPMYSELLKFLKYIVYFTNSLHQSSSTTPSCAHHTSSTKAQSAKIWLTWAIELVVLSCSLLPVVAYLLFLLPLALCLASAFTLSTSSQHSCYLCKASACIFSIFAFKAASRSVDSCWSWLICSVNWELGIEVPKKAPSAHPQF